MENASKALIIAGAILLSISIIGIGMYVFQQASGAMDGIGMESEKAQAYNQKFQSYIGPNVKGTSVKNLYDVVRNHNTTASDESLKVTVKLNSDAKTPSELNAEKAKILQGKSYKVEVANDGYDANTGYITKITITAL